MRLPKDSLQELRAERRNLRRLQVATERLGEDLARLQALRVADPGLEGRLDQLAVVLDLEETGAHARSALLAAVVEEAPVPHMIVPRLLPDAVHRALVQTLPSRVFFADAGDGHLGLPVPPTLAPVDAVVAWRFVADFVRRVLGPAVVERLRPALEARVQALGGTTLDAVRLVASMGRLVRREPGYAGESGRSQPWDLVTVVLWLTGPDDGGCGGTLRGSGDDPGQVVACHPGAALVVLDPGGAYTYRSVSGDQVCVSYQFPIGPGAAGRQALGLSAPGD